MIDKINTIAAAAANVRANANRRVLVTGASKGIGKATAIMLAEQGFQVVMHYQSDKEGAEDAVQQIVSAVAATCVVGAQHGQRTQSAAQPVQSTQPVQLAQPQLLSFDISDRQACHEILSADIEKHGAYYGVVNNAGICRDAAFPAMEDSDWDAVIHTNLDGFYNVLKPCVMPMIQARRGGRIVTVASVSGLIGNRGQVNYSAAKAGIIGASKALAIELAKRAITVNCVAPGLIDTAMLEGGVAAAAGHLDEIMQHIPLRRVGTPMEVAGLICYLMSDLAAYVTRQVISINGGLI